MMSRAQTHLTDRVFETPGSQTKLASPVRIYGSQKGTVVANLQYSFAKK
jgi:hypothetical protein